MSTTFIPKFKRMDEPYIHGYSATRDDGIDVEVVQCCEQQWSVFLTRPNTDPATPRVVARSVEEYRLCGNGCVSRVDAFRIARTLL